MRSAIVKSGVVINVVEIQAGVAWIPPADCTVVETSAAGIGWSYDGQNFSAPAASPSSIYVDLVTKKWNGSAWVTETEEFTEGEKIRVIATIKNPDGTTYTGPGSSVKHRVPIFAGAQNAPNPDGTQIVTPTDEQIAILPLQFSSGVATFDFTPAKPVWFCAVPEKTSKWLKTLVTRAIVTKAAV